MNINWMGQTPNIHTRKCRNKVVGCVDVSCNANHLGAATSRPVSLQVYQLMKSWKYYI